MRILAIRGRNLASLYGDFELSLDRGPIAESGIFSIAGPTGAGKSTLIDALCLALYGDTPRFDERGKGVRPGREDQEEADLVDANDRRNLLSRGTGEGHAEVDFECVDGRTWRARWEVRRARGKPDGRFQNAQMTLRALDGAEVHSGLADVKRRIAERIGYSFAEFRRAVVLPQFEFRAFLDADPDTRAQILERVTGTEIYARLSRRAHEQASTARAACETVLRRAGDLQPLPPAEREALETRTAALLAARETARAEARATETDVRWLEAEHALSGELAAAEQELATVGVQAQAAEPRRVLLAEAEAAEPLRATRTDAERTAARVAEADGVRATAARAAESAASLREQRVAERAAAGANLSATLAETERLRPDVERARALDARWKETRAGAKTATDRLEEARVDRQGTVDVLAGAERRIAEARAQHEAAAEWLAQRASEQPLAADWPRWKTLLRDHASLDRDLAAATASAATLRNAIAKRALDRDALRAQASDHRKASEATGERLRLALADAGADDLGTLAERVKSTGDRVALAQALLEAARQARAAGADRDLAAHDGAAAREALRTLAAEERDLADRARLAEGRLAGAEEALARLQAALGLEQRRAELRQGEPCPLCGATEHPYAHGAPGESAVAAQKVAVRDEKAAQAALRADSQRVAARIAAEQQRETHAAQAIERQERALAAAEERFATLRTSFADADVPALAVSALEAQDVSAACAARAAADSEAAQAAQSAALKRTAAVAHARADAEQERAALEKVERELSATELELEREGGLLREAEEKARGLALRREGLEAELEPVLSFQPGWRDEARTAAVTLVRALEAIAAAHAERRKTVEETAAVLATLQVERESTRARLEERDAAVAAAEGAAASARQAADDLERQRARLLGGRSVERVEGERVDAEKAARDAAETAAALLSRAEQEVAAAKASTEAAKRTAVATAEAASVAAATLAEALGARSIDRARLDALLALGPEWIAGERRALAALEETRKTAEVTRAERHRKLDALRAAGRPAVGLEEARARAADATAQRDRAEAEHNTAVLELRRDDERRAAHAALGDELTRVEAEATRWGALAELIGSHDGRALRVFAQGLTLDALLAAANQHLTMLAPRYRLERVPRRDLDLQVVDGDLGNEVRGVNGLSGGESFLVSLALALGLASLSTRRAQARTLFIDEGFGTLDRDTLEHAVAAIDLLRSGNRTVGVISHVPELHERIGVRVTVERVSAGRSRLVVPGAGADRDAREARRAS